LMDHNPVKATKQQQGRGQASSSHSNTPRPAGPRANDRRNKGGRQNMIKIK